MKVCIPISEDHGIDSPVCGHFGSASAFLLVDTDTRAHRVFRNTSAHHEHGHCAPVSMLSSEQIDAFIVGGIGAGALGRLLAMGAEVYRGTPGSAAASIEALAKGALPSVDPAETCAHRHG